ncbi:MAG TPA: flagellar biosynthesis protein FlhB [Ideonella sp.]|uniref:flagellar biosynthesis protein FlhB n=1 Tax=Ideonella sp. TaxID=1929293 RepID=UPI002E2EE8A7|nr:flagellar biosynthesis protein FlhB [Ideonella sp.]HEX5687803.1 flagellar biosynthesis protein FlhB [Ideonella sp.]
MADSAQDRNLPASERKKGKAREDGQIPRSRDLAHFGALAMAGALLMGAARPLSGWMQQMLMSGLRFDHDTIADPAAMGERFWALGLKGLLVVVPMGLLMMAVAILAAVLGGGWNVSFKALKPDLARFNPISGIGRMFSKRHLLDLLKMIVLAAVVGAVGVFYLKAQWHGLTQLLAMPLPEGIATLSQTIAAGFGMMLLAVGGWALIDVPLQKHLWLEKLKMTREEVKQEHKDAEGNVEIKGKIKARMREMVRKRMLAAVPQADLVVMNPTHYAVALKYDENKMGAPRVIAKGTDLLALKIRDIARESKVPVLQAPPLARALYAHCELDQEVPATLFAAVAQVLAWVYALRRTPTARIDQPDVSIPDELDPHSPSFKRR